LVSLLNEGARSWFEIEFDEMVVDTPRGLSSYSCLCLT